MRTALLVSRAHSPPPPHPLRSGTSHFTNEALAVAAYISHLEVLDIDAHPARHVEEATEVGIIQEDVDRHPPQRGRDDLLENIDVSEDIHCYGNNLEAYQTFGDTMNRDVS